MNKYLKILRNKLFYHGCGLFPEFVTKSIYKQRLNQQLNLKNPVTFNEKLQWLKLNTYKDNNLVIKCADKFSVRDYVSENGCQEILIPIYASWDKASDIDWSKLPNKFVMKCNHGAGYNIICKDKSNLNIDKTVKKLNNWMKEDYWRKAVELVYRDIPKKIICEKFIETSNGALPYDYKIFCFNGKPKFVMVCTERESEKPKFYFMDENWHLLPYGVDYLDANISKLEKPQNFEKLFDYAMKLAKPFPFVRVDLYLNDGIINFGELTFIHSAGMDRELNNEENKNIDKIMGDLIKLDLNTKKYFKK
ncbi:ATP-grasp fold amidoligase family protein [Xenorhabdus doucetiae]|uniref:Teichuronopeptide biosynthesis TupA-like protein n=1 Tax=Xenorhabdus doucetiae TaxID=351671 RepID=A0A068QM61_9GAMM|nr:ATP-grasp fold amidoligase family protein [Xenorhabdus doucetiae]TYP07831.1 teichuronopeptide biosynthesis TupA-like protein [Xenorhabdus doucetiae]CDG15853.1 WemI [Xenorhabdus doucetiae]